MIVIILKLILYSNRAIKYRQKKLAEKNRGTEEFVSIAAETTQGQLKSPQMIIEDPFDREVGH